MGILKGVALVLTLLGAVALVARRRLMVVTAFGSSMEPTFPTGTRLLVLRTRRVSRGDVVVLLHPDNDRPGDDPFASHYLVKRLAALPGDDVPASVATVVESEDGKVPAGSAVVLGDSEHSTDSRSWGYAPLGHIVGKSIRRLERLDPDAYLPAHDEPGAVGPTA